MATEEFEKEEYENLGHDRIFKSLLSQFLEDYLKCFYPKFHEKVNWKRPVRLLTEKTDHPKLNIKGNEPRYVDVLFEVFLGKEEEKVLLHFENQSYSQTIFPRRVYEYNCLVRSNHPDVPVYSFTICFGTYPHTVKRDFYEFNTAEGVAANTFHFNEVNLKNHRWNDPKLIDNPIIWAMAPLMKREEGQSDYDIMYSSLLKVVEEYYNLGTDKAEVITLFLDYYFQPSDNVIKSLIVDLRKDVAEGEEAMLTVESRIKEGSQSRAKSSMLKAAIRYKFFDGRKIPEDTLNIIESLPEGSSPERLIGDLMQIKDDDKQKIAKMNKLLSKNAI